MTDVPIDELLSLAIKRAMNPRRIPVSTYRLQFHAGFTFRDAQAIVPYLADLGVTHIYASPYLRAVSGSTHGYDVVDHCKLNPELGTQNDYEALLKSLTDHEMSHILDTVPNHMGVDTDDNAWWNDVLEHGRHSKYAGYFDIAWNGGGRADLKDRVLLPILGEPYGTVLERGELKLQFDSQHRQFYVQCYNRRLSVSPATHRLITKSPKKATLEDIESALQTINGIPGQPRSFDALDKLLASQHYRLAYWKVASEEINYRRFFDINALAALAMERPNVFEDTHAFTLQLAAQGKITGLRVDHPDGLYDPRQYLRNLQEHFILACAHEILAESLQLNDSNWDTLKPRLLGQLHRHHFEPKQYPLYVVVEKILATNEELPLDWACDGTSGYDFITMVNGLFIDPAGEVPFTNLCKRIVGNDTVFEELAYQKKLMILDTSMASELNRLTRQLARLAAIDRHACDFTRRALHHALRQIIACFPVYRSYITSQGVSQSDSSVLESAIHRAREHDRSVSPAIFDFIRNVVLQCPLDSSTSRPLSAQLRFAAKFQQLTAPVMAKGVEDTAFYIYQRFVSLNEVGGDPSRFDVEPGQVHDYFLSRARDWPHALNPLSTHDTKRSEDVRARLNVLSELPDEWREHVDRWMKINAPHRVIINGMMAPAPDEEYLIYQTILGAWPVEVHSDESHSKFVKRICEYMAKAMREAKLRTSWTAPNGEWESAVQNFIVKILDQKLATEFLADFDPFRRKVAHFGLLNSLSQTLLRLGAPGVPDTYQGTELWDFSLVDPDNRRPVDYQRRQAALKDWTNETNPKIVRALLNTPEEGRAKLWLTRQVLRCRREHADLFTTGDYQPLQATGEKSHHIFAFARRFEKQTAIVIIPRLIATLSPLPISLPLGEQTWGDIRMDIRGQKYGSTFTNILTGERLTAKAKQGCASLRMADILAKFPVAVLLAEM